MKEHEIAEILGITDSRVSQVLKPIKKQIQDAAIIETVADIYRDDKEYSKLEIEWIRL